ncbi:MAG TPA: hypothetical protein VFV32_14280, partial [Acidimicrobiales bacterium]|nr:hypothetical protein [Acidimicrobiales bacterium]
MRDARERRLVGAAAAAVALALVLAGPAALAQTDEVPGTDQVPDPGAQLSWEQRWEASALDAPFDVPDHVVRVQPFALSGAMRYEKQGPTDHI